MEGTGRRRRTRFLGGRCRRSRLPILGLHTGQNMRDLSLPPADTPSAAVTAVEAETDISCHLC
jgi:hypothetical protein